ncbi:hypothetical protein Bphyt_6355 [Paraburkholderia phytofirmans PsJN]|uniref:Uncharacterized protein n=1 Tax=Paraburkholderia phytofirmans (strain DSM 17436 / LMG 22146 / PsJN) TaxID=398527 RepID=B2T8L6_PARPJ|nr:hypothetical protein Bphyt_6355 [Paraburkholderia phytofirmans PsJN]
MGSVKLPGMRRHYGRSDGYQKAVGTFRASSTNSRHRTSGFDRAKCSIDVGRMRNVAGSARSTEENSVRVARAWKRAMEQDRLRNTRK